MGVTAAVSGAALGTRNKLLGKINPTKVKRYWPGKAPQWADVGGDEDGDILDILGKALPRHHDTCSSDPALRDDPRLRRLAASVIDNRDEARADHHRRIRQAAETEEEEERVQGLGAEEEEDEEAVEERRRRMRENIARMREREEAALLLLPLPEEDEEAEEEEESNSEYEMDSEEEETTGGGMAMVKPVFVPTSERDTIAERERLAREERAFEEKEQRRVEERKVETKHILIQEIDKEEQIQKNLEMEAEVASVDTDDEKNEAQEYEAWKVREIGRIKRQREDTEEMEEVKRMRCMTEQERREWERKNPKPAPPPKQRWRFMQKYYHKGAFFQDDDKNILKRDFSAPTGEDKMDKTILPKVMQVKHFGRSGRTKWTHLGNEDTTVWDNAGDPVLRAKYTAKMAGMNAPIAKPKGSRKLKDWDTK